MLDHPVLLPTDGLYAVIVFIVAHLGGEGVPLGAGGELALLAREVAYLALQPWHEAVGLGVV